MPGGNIPKARKADAAYKQDVINKTAAYAKSKGVGKSDRPKTTKERVDQGFDQFAPKPKAKPKAPAKAKAKAAAPKKVANAPKPKRKPARETMAMKRAMGSK